MRIYAILNVTRRQSLTIIKNESWAAWRKLHAWVGVINQESSLPDRMCCSDGGVDDAR